MGFGGEIERAEEMGRRDLKRRAGDEAHWFFEMEGTEEVVQGGCVLVVSGREKMKEKNSGVERLRNMKGKEIEWFL